MKLFLILSVFLAILFASSCSDTSSKTNSGDLFSKQEVLAEQCQDTLDNDGDGKIDCDDEGCKGFVFCQKILKTENTAVDCSDTLDNDSDGKIDCEDEDCKGFVFCASKVENTAVLCQDGLDSDDDGKIDCEDEDCQGFTFCATTEENTAIVCQDNRDNDGDGKVDCDDEDCQGFTFCDKKVENTAALCNDNQDNDDDNKTDCEDPDCQVFSFCIAGEENTSTACNDNQDNDNDGKVDCDDPDCQGFTFCTSAPKVENTAALCQDGIDNDNDLATDCDDTDCQGFTFCQPLLENTAVKCQDSEDNDNDGLVDCDDPDCKGFTFCAVEIPVENTAVLCQDNIDNDGDGLVDCDDNDCQGFTFCAVKIPVENTAVLCQDNIDNDGNGLVDCDDPECKGFTFCAVETPVENTAVLCQDNIDNDGDGLVDCDDNDCQGFTFCGTFNTEDSSTKCQDGADNDGDGLVDCDDNDCWQFSFCNTYNGDPITDAWGATWDSIERGKKTWSEAKAICESLGGRLPTATELYRNNATSGTGDIAQTYNTNYLWTLIAEYRTNEMVTIRLSDGHVSNDDNADGSVLNFRCIWPNDDDSGFDNQKCYGNPDEECTKYDKYYNIDSLDRPALDYVAATNECNFYGASIPTLTHWSENIHLGLSNGSNTWNWVGDAIYWYNRGVGSSIIRWTGKGLPSWRYQNSNMGSLASHTNKEHFRCIGLENQSVFAEPESNNCNGASGCFTNNHRATKLNADSEDRVATTFSSAVETCRNLGGNLAQPRDFIENIHQGWGNGSNSWLWTSDMLYWYSGGYGYNLLKWNGTGTERWYHQISTTFERSGTGSTTRAYRCVWGQNRPTLPVCQNATDVLKWNGSDFECQTFTNGTSNGKANGSEKIDPWGNAWDGVARSANYENAKTKCKSLGGRLPTANELYRINAGNPIVISNVATAASTDYLWSSIATYNDNQHITVRLSDGHIARQTLTTENYYRCIWPAKSSDILNGNVCNGTPGSACFETSTMIADSNDRVAMDYAAAVNECLAVGGHLMDSSSFVNLVQEGLPNGSNSWNWINEAVYWYSGNYGLHLVKWSGINTAWNGGSGEQAVTSYNSNYKFRCVYNKTLK